MIDDQEDYLKQLMEHCGKLNLLHKMLVKLKERGHKVCW
jgi:hypothetical protein